MAIDFSALNSPKAPPKKRAVATRATPAPTRTEDAKPMSVRRHEGLMGLASLAQGACLMTGQFADAMTIAKFFPPVSMELANIAEEYESVAAPIDFLIKIGPFGALITAVLPLALQIATNHGAVDASTAAGLGVLPPEILATQMKTEMMRSQAEIIRAQNEAQKAANEAQAEMQKLMDEQAKGNA